MQLMKDYHERVKKLLPGGVHYNFNLPWEESPIHYVNTKGSRVWDMDGKEYLDLYARFGAMILGHGNKEYNNALKDVMDRVLSVSHCDIDAEALEAIHKYVPSAELIRFGLSGTEIIQNAIRVARAYTGRNKFVRFNNHYHGNADNIMGGKSMDGFLLPYLQKKYNSCIKAALLTGFIFGLFVLPGYVFSSFETATAYPFYVGQLMAFSVFVAFIMNKTRGNVIFFIFSFWLVASGSKLQFYNFVVSVQILEFVFFVILSVGIYMYYKLAKKEDLNKNSLACFPEYLLNRG